MGCATLSKKKLLKAVVFICSALLTATETRDAGRRFLDLDDFE